MSSFEQERKAIEGHFNTQWNLNTNTMKHIPVIYQNSKQKQPTGDFLTFRIVQTQAKQAELIGQGACMLRFENLIQLDVLTLLQSGTSNARKIADQASKIFKRIQLVDGGGGISTFKIPSIRNFGPLGDRFRVVVSCPYIRDVRQ